MKFITTKNKFVQYLNYQYPNVFYLSDTIASLKLNIYEVRNNAIQKKIFIVLIF
jgi:hypothetical protein